MQQLSQTYISKMVKYRMLQCYKCCSGTNFSSAITPQINSHKNVLCQWNYKMYICMSTLLESIGALWSLTSKGDTFQFNVLPFSLWRATWACLKFTLSHLMARGIKTQPYLDDQFLCGPTKEQATWDTCTIFTHFKVLGLIGNSEIKAHKTRNKSQNSLV